MSFLFPTLKSRERESENEQLAARKKGRRKEGRRNTTNLIHFTDRKPENQALNRTRPRKVSAAEN